MTDSNQLPDLHADSVQVLAELDGKTDFEKLLDLHFTCEHTKKYLKTFDQKDVENSLKSWAFKVDKKLTISQSKIKSFWDMVNGNSCPKTFNESLTNRNVSTMKESPAMVDGQLFEYYATGQKNYTNEIPDESGIHLKGGGVSKKGENIVYHAELWKKFVQRSNYKRIKTGLTLKFSNEFYSISSLPDVVCDKVKGKDIIIDLKFGDSEGTYGDYSWHDEKLPTKEKLLLQAKVNKFIYFKNYAKDAPFIFYIANKANKNAKARLIEFKSFDGMIEETEKLIAETYKGISFLRDNNFFEPKPDVKFCDFCKVQNCSTKTDVPIVKTLKV